LKKKTIENLNPPETYDWKFLWYGAGDSPMTVAC